MKKLRILVVNDFASNASLLEKHLNQKIDAIYFSDDPVITKTKNSLFFKNDNLNSCVKEVKKLSKEYDVFVTFGWFSAAICYLANVKYVMYIVDSFIDPKYRIWKKYPFLKKKFFDLLLKDSFKNADMVITGSPNDANIVRKYRKDVKPIFQMVDYDTFTENVPNKERNEKSFMFFSPQRFDPNKGHEILFKAIELTKSDFIVLQTDWGEGDYYEKMIKNKPTKVKIIPKIDRSEMPTHYNSSDALLGQVSSSVCGGIEREAIVCGLPVFCYVSYEYTENDPFCKSKEPTVIAEYLDKIVEDKNFRLELKKKQLEWTKKTFDSKRIASEWNEVLHNVIENKNQKKINPFYNLVLKLYFRRE